MELYTIRQARGEEVLKIQRFINEHWKNGHALVKSKQLLDFQHYDKVNNRYTYIIAENNVSHAIDALVGFIPTSQYDSQLSSQGDYWAAIWKKRDDIINEEINDVGMEVFMKIFEIPNLHSFTAIGISKVAMKIYKAFQCKIGYLHHYFILNEKTEVFKVAANVEGIHLGFPHDYAEDNDWTISEIDMSELEGVALEGYYKPKKSTTYFINRYANHPIYKYGFLGISKGKIVKSILAYRVLEANKGRIVRVVDVLGKLEGSIYSQFQFFLNKINAEYVDILNYGIPMEVFQKMGFKELDFNGSLILPNYFEPFEQCNVKIDIAIKADYDDYVAFKGDSDQDRPNVL